MQKKSVIANLSSAESNTVVLCDKAKNLIWNAANKLKGSLRRQFMAKTVQEPGPGSQSFAEQQLEWNRGTIRKGMHELSSGISCIDSFSLKGRKKSEERMLNLEDEIRDIADSKSQVDATLFTSRLYLKMTARQVRKQLILQKGYKDMDLPKRRSVSSILNRLGYRLKIVKKINR